MIKKLKRHSHKYKYIRIIISVFLYLFLPIYLCVYLKILPFKFLLVFYLAGFLIIFYLSKKRWKKENRLILESQDLQEKLNILNDEISKELKNKIALQEKIKRYYSLKEIIEQINQNLDLESIANILVSIVFSYIAKNKGRCILYLVDSQNQRLNLFKTEKEDKQLIIKTKEGDIFDLWVLRHAQPLLVEDIRKDFRFDLEKLKTQNSRFISSLVSCPFISEHKFLGILRVDNREPNFYSQDDLRFLMTACDLGAVALENAQLFQKTLELAIHDGLTSLYTKGYFLERLKEECQRSIHQNKVLSLLLLDIDHFKNYNDKFGHTAGDIVLKNLSLTMSNFFKDLQPLLISRFGGEEFCIILPSIDKKKAYNLAEELCLEIQNSKIILRQQPTNITVSIGVASLPLDAKDEDGLIFKADQAMYTAKQKGRNQVVCANNYE